MIPPWILGIGQFFAAVLVERLVIDNAIEYVRSELIRRKLLIKIQETLQEVIQSFPDGKYIFENFDLEGYLADETVKQEIGALLNINSGTPNIELLKNKWIEKLGGQLKGNYQLIIESFIRTLNRKIWEIEEIRDNLQLREQRYSSELIRNYLPGISSKLDIVLASLPSKDETDTSSLVFQGQLDVCKSLLKTGSSSAALVQLLRLEEESRSQPLSTSLKSKLQGLIGACMLDEGNEEESRERFVRSYQLCPGEPEAVANFALAHLLAGDIDAAIEQANLALSIKPVGTNARAVRLDAQARKNNFNNLGSLIEEEYLHDHNYVHALGLILFRDKGDLELSEKYLRLSWAQAPGDMYVGLTLCSIIVKKQLNNTFPFGPEIISGIEFRNKIDEALKILEIILENVEKGDNKKKRLNVIASRAGLRAMCDDIAGAKDDCTEVLKYDPTYELGLHNRALIALVEEDYELAVANFRKLNNEYIFSQNLVLAVVRAYIGIGKISDALELINGAEGRIVPNEKYHYEVMKALAYIKNGEPAKALEVKFSILAFPECLEIFEAAGKIDLFLKNYEEANKNFNSALSLATSDFDKKRINLSIANIFYNLRQFDSAMDQFERLDINFATNVELARFYVSAAYAAREYGKAYITAEKLRTGGIEDNFLLEVEVWVSEFLGDLPQALSLAKLQAKLRPFEITYQVNIARLEFRLNNLHGAIKILETINLQSVGAFELMQVAEMYAFMQQYDKSIEIAYQAYIKGRFIPEIHRSYISLFLRLEKNVVLERDIVDANTAVLVEGERQKRWIRIVSLFPITENMEYSANSDMSRLLLGHRVGDIINYGDNDFQNNSFVVKEIQSLYVRAFQEILEDYDLKFPGDKGLQTFHIQNDDYSSFFLNIARMGIHTEKIHDFFKLGAITIEKHCSVTGRNQILVWKALQVSRGERIIASTGTHGDQDIQNGSASSSTEITLSLSSLLTIDYLECLELLPARFEKLFVSQRMVDELEKTSHDLDRDSALGRQTIGYHGGQFFMTETPKEEVERNRNSVLKLMDFVKTFTKIVPVKPELAEFLIKKESDDLIFVGDVTNSSILVAKTTGTALLCDELAAARFAGAKHNVLSFWSQPLFIDLKNRKLIDESKYAHICYQLLSADYFFTTINYDVINTILLEDEFQSSKRLDNLLLGLRGPETLENEAIRISALVTKYLYFAAPSREHKRFVLDKLMNAIVIGRIKDKVITKLQILVNREFALAPVQADEFNVDLELWRKINQRPDELMWFPKI